MLLQAVGVDASFFDAIAVLIAVVALAQLPVGPSVGAAAAVLILGSDRRSSDDRHGYGRRTLLRGVGRRRPALARDQSGTVAACSCPSGAVALTRCPAGCLRSVAPPALAQRVVEDRLVVVFAGDHDDLVPDARMDDSFVVDLGSKAFGVDGREGVTGAVHAPAPVAATDDCDEVAVASTWVREEKLETALPNPPKVTSGKVVVHKTRELVSA